MIDLHVHLLPDFDDGPSVWEESIDMCRMAEADGVTHAVATPHVLGNFPCVEWKTIQEKVTELQTRLSEQGINLPIHPGAELYFDERILSQIEKGAMTLNGSGRYLLVEFPYSWVPHNYLDFFFQLQGKGLRPILAHPERNVEIQANPAILRSALDKGTLIQVTAGSLEGTFGHEEARFSKKLLKKGMVQFVGSDAHGMSDRLPCLSTAFQIARRIVGTEDAEKLFIENPQKVLEGEEIE